MSVCVPACPWTGQMCGCGWVLSVWMKEWTCVVFFVCGTLSLIPKSVTKCNYFPMTTVLQPVWWAHKITSESKVPSLFSFAVCCKQTFMPPEKVKLIHINKEISSFFGQTVHTNVQFFVILMDNIIHFQCWCNAVCCCHSHFIFQLIHISPLLISHVFKKKKKKSQYNSYSDFKEAYFVINWCICLPVFLFGLFAWDGSSSLFNIFKNAEQCVLLVWLYFSFINECKSKVSACFFFLVCLDVCVLYILL